MVHDGRGPEARMNWTDLAGRWRHLVDGLRGRLPDPGAEVPDRDKAPDDPLEREIEEANDMRVGRPSSDREFRQ